MPGPNGALTVRIDDGTTDRHVTQHVRSLGFTKVAPGGHQATRARLVLPRGTFGDLGPQDKLYVYDARTGRTTSEGYLENPTPLDGPNGQEYDLTAIGGMGRANDETRALVYIDSSADHWAKDPFAHGGSTDETGTWPADPTAARMKAQIPEGQTVATNGFAGLDYTLLDRIGMNLGAIAVYTESGKVSSDWGGQLVHPGGSLNIGGVAAISTAGLGSNWFVDDDFPDPTDYFALRLVRLGGATNVADDLTWTNFRAWVIGQRLDRYGTPLVGAAGMVSTTSVLASQVVEDLLGRILTMCDPTTADIATTSWLIDQLVYADGVKAATVLTDLEAWEPDYLWEIGETLPNGLHRFAYRPWPTEPRYEVSVKDGWRQTGSDIDLCNRILVSWTDGAGRKQTLPVTLADLTVGFSTAFGPAADLPYIRDAEPITLPDGLGSEANALRIGRGILTDKLNPPKSGTIVVRRPIIDHLTGSRVMPWEIEPGYLVRVRETGDDLRLTEMSYDDDSVSATLTLGRPVLTIEQRLARLDAA